jgi:hypothetical protein
MKISLLIVVLGLGIAASVAQQPGGAPTGQPPSNTTAPAQGGALRVNSPQVNQVLSQNFVHVTYQLVNRGVSAAPSPNFTIQIDGADPITTTAYDYNFTGLTAGPHTVTVTLVDANGVPIANSSVAVKFSVANQPRGGGAASLFHSNRELTLATSDVGTPLPMLSMVGFMVLLGGIFTTIRNR